MTTSEMSPGKTYCKLFKNKKFSFEVGNCTFIDPADEMKSLILQQKTWMEIDGYVPVLNVGTYDDRELFYSLHQEEIPSVLVKIHVRTQNPGFIVLRVYDHEEQVLWWVTNRDFEKHKQVEIDHLLLKTQQLWGYDMEMEEEKAENSLEEVKIVEEEMEDNLSHLPHGINTKYMCKMHLSDTDDIDAILAKAITGDDVRDKCLGLLFEEINYVVMSALVAPEKACFSTRGESLAKYQQKMRQLRFNLKDTVKLARRLIDSLLKASAGVEMTAEELRREEQHMDMVDIPCPRCNEKKVGLRSSFFIPGRAADYQFECLKCVRHGSRLGYKDEDQHTYSTRLRILESF
ncbi:hypothetical protein MKX03_011284 [Papaver bracteatum]|nr:hypothetical protein MKX03_011284 [Papaver bracteatum]